MTIFLTFDLEAPSSAQCEFQFLLVSTPKHVGLFVGDRVFRHIRSPWKFIDRKNFQIGILGKLTLKVNSYPSGLTLITKYHVICVRNCFSAPFARNPSTSFRAKFTTLKSWFLITNIINNICEEIICTNFTRDRWDPLSSVRPAVNYDFL